MAALPCRLDWRTFNFLDHRLWSFLCVLPGLFGWSDNWIIWWACCQTLAIRYLVAKNCWELRCSHPKRGKLQGRWTRLFDDEPPVPPCCRRTCLLACLVSLIRNNRFDQDLWISIDSFGRSHRASTGPKSHWGWEAGPFSQWDLGWVRHSSKVWSATEDILSIKRSEKPSQDWVVEARVVIRGEAVIRGELGGCV